MTWKEWMTKHRELLNFIYKMSFTICLFLFFIGIVWGMSYSNHSHFLYLIAFIFFLPTIIIILLRLIIEFGE